MIISPHYFSDAQAMRGKIYYIKNKINTSRCAFEIKEDVTLVIRVPRALGVISSNLEIFDEAKAHVLIFKPLLWQGLNNEYDEYVIDLNPGELGVGLYFYRIKLLRFGQTVYAYKDENSVCFNERDLLDDCFQLTVYKRERQIPANSYGGVIYHIFVDRFNRGGRAQNLKGEIFPKNWDMIPEYPEYPGAPLKNNTFYGGTLDGVRAKLPYLNSLGVTKIYLSPIFESVSNHKYDTADYMSTDSAFGGDEALVDLIYEAKKYNIGIILDGVFNHTGADSVYFNKFSRYNETGAYQSKSSPFYDWYEFKNYPDDYVSWWGIEILPRINPSVPSCQDFIAGEGGVVDKYASLGIFGLRLDVADELSDEFIAKIKDRLLSHNKNAVLYGEVWEDASNKIAYGKRKKYYLGRELDGVMNYPVRAGIIDYIRNSDIKELSFALSDIINNAPKEIADMQMNLLGTHDTERIITALCGESPEGKTNARLREMHISPGSLAYAEKCVINAFTILFTLPGIPSVYYGDEAGLEGYSDPFNRMPYPWGKENGRILSSVKKLGNLRKLRAYKSGEFELCYIDSSLLIFKREDRSSYITLYNNSDNPLEIEFNTQVKILFGEVSLNNSMVVVPAKTACIIKSTKNNAFKINN